MSTLRIWYGPTGVHGGDLGEEAALAAVGAAVDHEPAAAGEDRAVLLHTGLELEDHALAPMVGRDELLPSAPPKSGGASRVAYWS
jgi:hypothetical protein